MRQTILIIGGTSGLGRKLCELYCLEGHKVAVVGRRESLLNSLSKQFPNNVIPFQYDITSPTCFDDIQNIIGRLNGIDKLILTASVVDFNPELEFLIEKKTAEVNVLGYISVLNVAYHYFSNKGKGHIVVVTSIASARGNKTAPAYNASKAFQSSYIEGLRLKIMQKKNSVFVTHLIPGYMDTQMAKGERMFWVADIEKAASQAKAAIERKKKTSFITKRWIFIYYFYKFLPSFIYAPLMNSGIRIKKTNH